MERVCVYSSAVLVAACMMFAPCEATALGKETVPVTESFESYAPGYAMTNALGWTVLREVDVALVTNMSTGLTSPYFPGAPDAKVLNIAGTVTCDINTNTVRYVYVDMMVRPQCREKPPVIDDSPAPMVVCYIDNDQHLVVRHKWFSIENGLYYPAWSTSTSVDIPSNDWTRLSITLLFNPGDYGYWFDIYFQVRINGGAPLTWDLGYTQTENNEIDPPGGPWLLTGNLPIEYDGRVSSVSAAGTCQIDDFVISNEEGASPVAERTAHGTPKSWIDLKYGVPADYEVKDGEDTDSDGRTTWQEYWAGTDPTDPDSEFRMLTTTRGWSIAWLGGTNADNFPYRVWRSTNLVPQVPFQTWDWSTDVARTGTTNIWIDEQASNTFPRAFYKVTAPTNGW